MLNIGVNHPNWNGGEFAGRGILERSKIKIICVHCGISDKRVLMVHHKDSNRKNNEIKNLVWLCQNCHHLVHDYNISI
jgi:5-methylcytosine-specific restriction endonuclease McrA